MGPNVPEMQRFHCTLKFFPGHLVHALVLCQLTQFLLGSGEVLLHFVELKFIVKSHEIHSHFGSILEMRYLLARVSIDDAFWTHSKTKDSFDLILHDPNKQKMV